MDTEGSFLGVKKPDGKANHLSSCMRQSVPEIQIYLCFKLVVIQNVF
jgi:hypothetical protein